MTMTREKIKELMATARDMGDEHQFFTITIKELLSLLALAERALPELDPMTLKKMRFIKEQGGELVGVIMARGSERAHIDMGRVTWSGDDAQPQGQALPELPPLPEPEHDYVTAPGFTASQMHAYARVYASQLALPAGPVPEGAVISRRLLLKAIQAINYHLEPESPEEYEQTMKELGALLDPSPAVAQPDNTAAWESGELGRSAEHAKRAPAEVERQVAAAVAQPVADERDAYCEMTPGQMTAYAHSVANRGSEICQEQNEQAWKLLRELAACTRADPGRGRSYEGTRTTVNTKADLMQRVDAALLARAALCQPADEGGKS